MAAEPARLIVTADDVGLHPATSAGALRAHRDGIVTACSVVACGADFRGAVAALAACPGLAVGVHLTLVEGRPLSEPRDVPSLVRRDGTFRASFRAFSLAWMTGLIDRTEVERELAAQIRRVQDAGLVVRHLNSHQHVHVLPGVFAVVLRLAREHGVGWVRVPFDPRPEGGRGFARRLALGAMNAFGRRARDVARSAGIACPDRIAGVARAGHLDEAALVALASGLAGVTELVSHPGTDDVALGARFPSWRYDWQAELAALCSPRVRAALETNRVALVAPGPGPQDLGAPPDRASPRH